VRTLRDRAAAAESWRTIRPLLEPLEAAFSGDTAALSALLGALRDAAGMLAGDAAWSRPAGRAAAELFTALEAAAADGPRTVGPGSLPALLQPLLDDVAVRPPQGGHPRIFIWGLIEARLQQADVTILGGLNEGTWPSLPAPDPWLAPAIRSQLGLPGLERRIGIEAEQFAAALGGSEILLTRARRDLRSPTIASRFWLRLDAMTGGLDGAPHLAAWAAAIDAGGAAKPADRPAPCPPVEDRPRKIAVTKLDRLQADPFAFYADAMLRLRAWDAIDADPSPAWRGTAVHRIFELWMKEDGLDPARLRPRAEALLAETAAHPVLRALWTPRLIEAIEWVAGQLTDDMAKGRLAVAAERKGSTKVAGITLEGTADRIDRSADGTLAVVDYKTGKPPSTAAVANGFSMQLGLLGLIAEAGGFGPDLAGIPRDFEYWSLGSKSGQLGYRASPVGTRANQIAPDEFTTRAAAIFEGAVQRWLTGDDPFIAKLHPEYAPYGDYDQLMRLDEWYGRGGKA